MLLNMSRYYNYFLKYFMKKIFTLLKNIYINIFTLKYIISSHKMSFNFINFFNNYKKVCYFLLSFLIFMLFNLKILFFYNFLNNITIFKNLIYMHC